MNLNAALIRSKSFRWPGCCRVNSSRSCPASFSRPRCASRSARPPTDSGFSGQSCAARRYPCSASAMKLCAASRLAGAERDRRGNDRVCPAGEESAAPPSPISFVDATAATGSSWRGTRSNPISVTRAQAMTKSHSHRERVKEYLSAVISL